MIDLKEYKEETKKTLNNLFAEAEKKNQEIFLRSLFAIDPDHFTYRKRYNLINLEFRELCEMLRAFNKLSFIDEAPSGEHKKNHTRLNLFRYCHIIEADLPYMVIANMVRILVEEPYNTRIYKLDKNGEKIVCEYPSKKLYYLKNLGEKIGFKLESIWYKFFVPELRNAFSHSQYYLNKDGDIILTSQDSPTTIINRKLSKDFYTHEEIENIYIAANIFLKVFVDIVNKFKEKYKNGKSYSVGKGLPPIMFDSDIGWIFNTEGWIFFYKDNNRESNRIFYTFTKIKPDSLKDNNND